MQLISAHRNGLTVHYSYGSKYAPAHILRLQTALGKCFSNETPYPSMIEQATGCTHQRRIELIQRISKSPSSIEELVQRSKMSYSAVARHARKLEARGYITLNDGRYHTAAPDGYLALELSKIVTHVSQHKTIP